MKLLKLSVVLLALVMGACESGFPTEPEQPQLCKANDPRPACEGIVSGPPRGTKEGEVPESE
jgi:hypothetical protein